ncbi:MAG: hypothetical protein WC307_01710 [Candidatus Nanoarchaeia archaeon]|jgi:hypothetical protein
MYEYLIICTKEGIPIKTLGNPPESYPDYLITGLAQMIEANQLDQQQYNDFTVHKDEYGFYAKTIDGDEIRLLKGKHVNAVVSMYHENAFRTAKEVLKSYDIPQEQIGFIKGTLVYEIIDESIRQEIKASQIE